MTNLPFLTATPREGLRGARVKARPEDFRVEELPLYEPAGTGDHVYLWLEKRGITTHEAVRRLARAFGRNPREAGLAGLKDAQAVTRQWVSFEHVSDEQARALDLGSEVKVLDVRRHQNKLRMGHLRGNRFVIRLRAAEAPEAPPQTPAATFAEWQTAARAALDQLARTGVPNYYGPQRFGRHGDNAALGRKLVQGDEAGFRAALAAAQGPGLARDRRFRNLLVNAFQAELFNRVLARRMPRVDALLAGDLAWLHRNGAVFKVGDPALEQPRCAAFEISPSGPLFGPKMPFPEGEPGRIEREVLAESGVGVADFGRPEAERQPGARRPLRVPFLEPPGVNADPEGLLLTFALPPGAYATVVLREILGDAPVGDLERWE